MTDAEIEALDTPDTWPNVFDNRTQAALALADALCGDTTHELGPELITALRGGFSEREMAELILVCGQANLNNRA